MRRRALSSVLTAFLLLIVGYCLSCGDDPEEPRPVIEPGAGVSFQDAALRLGDSLADMQALFGAANLRDLGPLGARFDYADLGLSGHLTGSGDAATVVRITLYTESGASVADGVGIGSAESDVRAAFGEPVRDPFLNAWWYGDSDIGFEWGADGVARIHLFESDR